MAQNNFANMHADAVRRAREMYSRSRYAETKPQAEKRDSTPENKHIQNMQKSTQKPKDNKNDLFEFLLKDPDKTIILALMIILSSEKTDSSLLFALIYLLI